MNVLGKVHWSDFVDSEKQLTENTMVLAELLYEMCNISLVLKKKNNDGFNPVNKDGVELIINKASKILEKFHM